MEGEEERIILVKHLSRCVHSMSFISIDDYYGGLRSDDVGGMKRGNEKGVRV